MATSQKEELTFSESHIAAAGDNDVFGPDVDRGKDQVVQHVAARNNTTGITHLILFKKRGGEEWVIEDQQNPVAGTWYGHHDEIHLYHGSKLGIRFVGCAAADDLDVDILGYTKNVE